ncbi:MAG: hypothetical protein HRU38_09975 [Saccharospirillaceae bacterium]|nr:hypothetical protein [Pseudomonadales bacterium]NRB78980.1 hypothetical protein [Saccharospirillaceae bacterium]
MSACCPTPKNDHLPCPSCFQHNKTLSDDTLFHQLCSPHNQLIKIQTFYFCANPNCKIVYYGNEGDSYTQEDCRWLVGQKQTSTSKMICYCFDITQQVLLDELKTDKKGDIKKFVITQTKAKRCACEIRNPSGRCCLIDFPK